MNKFLTMHNLLISLVANDNPLKVKHRTKEKTNRRLQRVAKKSADEKVKQHLAVEAAPLGQTSKSDLTSA